MLAYGAGRHLAWRLKEGFAMLGTEQDQTWRPSGLEIFPHFCAPSDSKADRERRAGLSGPVKVIVKDGVRISQ